ncbi:PAS/PAC sensor signal transduction histidine kinase [Halorubrum californiense DSM 19288]|uniref:histidine kinase n=1 Tax=Halorubrum californiense DSM 19288 TaxID=1227465 RepID=M0EDJ3_9EURY|nr:MULTISPECIES: histidine kinase N-terminal 7TM domain-containing protein [Halorubrum]ELZ45820.1 PAS/PAC sensor signal transduction histidine kinase [Halorubrum californiense DSM 19288]TKX69058.1 PAS domain S-box protein [Halorubrum sp. GN11GM_10-3_MGM]
MAWQPTPYTVPLLVAAVASFGFAAYAFGNRSRGGHALLWSFVGVAGTAGLWSLAYAAQLSATSLDLTLFFNRFVWLGSAGLAVAWPVFVLSYVDRTAWLDRRRFALFWVVPVAVVGAAWTVGVDPLFYADPTLVDAGGFRILQYAPTPALLGFVGYTYAVNLFTFAVLGYAAVSRDGVFRRQAAVLFVAGVAPLTLGAAGIAGIVGPDRGLVDFTPIAFSGTSALLAWVVFRYRLLDVSPIARDAVFANLSDGVVVCDADGRVVDSNDPAEALFPDAELGVHAGEAFDGVPAVADAVTGEASDDEFRVTVGGDDGAPRFLTVDVHDITGPGTSRGGTVLLFRDVTERETLQRRYRALIEKSPNVIAICGEDGLLRYVSPSIERLIGHKANEVEGRPVIDLVHPEDRREAQRAFERAFEGPEPQSLTHRIACADGSWRRFETVIERLFADTGEVVITATDVTDARRYEQRLQVLNRVLRHDLKNDANVIGGYADLLRDHVDEEGDPYLDVIDRKVQTLTHLSDQAREIDVALHSDADKTEIDLAALVDRLCESLGSSFPRATVTVTVPDSAVVAADELLESAVRNVLENAVVHNDDDDPHVEATVVGDGDRFRLDVVDDGPGIPPVERTVFSEARETALEHASGLGLWLVHWIVTESGGDLEIDTREPTGTVVRMWLPRAAEECE